jgi:hypothetical protein
VASAFEPESLTGTWIGERSGMEIVWTIEADGRVRLEGRRGHWIVSSDTLVVEFDALDGSATSGERAVYRFMASDPRVGHRRLFVYGFDLGPDGVLFTRQVSEEELARLQAAVKVGTPPPAPIVGEPSPAAPGAAPTSPASQRP